MRPRIAIVYSLARSGGTIFSKCLACIPGNVMLSEIRPQWSFYDPLTQARDWFGLITEQEHQQFLSRHGYNYLKAIQLLSTRCAERGLHLILRDWTHVDFFASQFPTRVTYGLSQYEVLKRDFDIRHIALVRHPVDLYLSLRKLTLPPDKDMATQDFLLGFRAFANIAKQAGFVRYEDFCDNPAAVIESVCRTLGINYSADFLDRHKGYTTITGDVFVGDPQGSDRVTVNNTGFDDGSFKKEGQNIQTGEEKGVRGTDRIGRPPSREGWAAIAAEFQQDPLYPKLLEELGYESLPPETGKTSQRAATMSGGGPCASK